MEWIGVDGARHTGYFGHWPDDSKQCATATKRNMHDKLCVDRDVTQLVDGLAVNGKVWKGTDGAATSYRCGKSIYGQGILSAELSITIDMQVEAPGHGKWWLDGKTGSNKHYCQQCMCSIVTPEAEVTNGVRLMHSAKWIVNRDGASVAVSPAAECVCMLSDAARINGIKSEGMRAKREGKALVERNNYGTYCMDDVAPIPDYMIKFPPGQFNRLRVHYNICMDPDLGVEWAALCHVACGCGPCKEQLKMPWVT